MELLVSVGHGEYLPLAQEGLAAEALTGPAAAWGSIRTAGATGSPGTLRW